MQCSKEMLDKHVDLENKMLNLNTCELTVVDMPLLTEYLQKHPEIKTLDLRDNRISVEGAKILAANTTLTTLILYGNKMGSECARYLAANTTLQTLNLGWNYIEADGATALATNTTLTSLSLYDNPLGLAGVKAFANNTTLKKLNLNSCRIGTEGAQALANNTTLKILSVTSNRINLEGIRALAANTTLTSLDVKNNNVREEGATALAANSTLRSLNVSCNGYISKAGVKALLANTTLTNLDLSYLLMGGYPNDEDFKHKLMSNTALVKLNIFCATQPKFAWIGKILTRNQVIPWLKTIHNARLMSQAKRSPNCPLGTIPAEVAGTINNFLQGANHFSFFMQQYDKRPDAKDLESAIQQAKSTEIHTNSI